MSKNSVLVEKLNEILAVLEGGFSQILFTYNDDFGDYYTATINDSSATRSQNLGSSFYYVQFSGMDDSSNYGFLTTLLMDALINVILKFSNFEDLSYEVIK
jgi:hypothetical protein